VVQSDFCKNAVRTLKQQLNVNKHKTDDGSVSVFVTLAAIQGKYWRWERNGWLLIDFHNESSVSSFNMNLRIRFRYSCAVDSIR
jgi:hypothetical protein